MPDLSVLLSFAVASALLAVTPGPSVVLVITAGADGGRRAGAITALGLALGTLTWGIVTSAGLGSVLAARPGLIAVVTALGGGYLLALAVGRFRAAAREGKTFEDAEPTPGRPLRDGLIVNLLNPSITIFLAAVIPPFLDLEAGPVWQQILALSVVLVAVSTVINTGYGVLGATVGMRVRRWAGSRRTTLAVAWAYTALGLAAMAAAALR